ncbi:PH domain-containing protein [Streptomyces sp. NBC_00335]|uniref:PH domain-containing protein n=1 Tax=unclassified Streptomyces TaxID=2593676 RepID=UPI0022566F7A|nr:MULTISPECIES: PH domain-containing protein [unclassified Streptomyces]MCX5406420.1 PH domain-containing protein [Streptomyces sp. NBC_00086]
MPDDGLLREYRTKPGNWVVFVAFFGLLGFFALATSELPWPRWVKLLVGALMAIFVGWVLYARSRRFTTVDHRGIAVRDAAGVRRLAWDDIHDIRAVDIPHVDGGTAPRTIVYAYRTDGRRLGLPCVDDVEQTAVGWEVVSLRSILAERRSADWVEDPRAEPRIARQAARWENAYRWLSGWRMPVAGAVILLPVLAVIVFFTGS